jgi:hypothetical protein
MALLVSLVLQTRDQRVTLGAQQNEIARARHLRHRSIHARQRPAVARHRQRSDRVLLRAEACRYEQQPGGSGSPRSSPHRFPLDDFEIQRRENLAGYPAGVSKGGIGGSAADQ